MLTYEQIHKWLAEKENKNKLLTFFSFILVFLIGFGSGSYEKNLKKSSQKTQNNYTITETKQPIQPAPTPAVLPQVAGEKTEAKTPETTGSDCLIKGNISSAGRKLYHVSGGAFYKTVKPEQCFKTEQEAQAAGFTKSQR